jgi:glycosyltransferase involved in cell wall biosynthesis
MANNNGLFVERGDAESLAGALHTLITDDARRAELGRNARQLIERDLNWDSLARQTVEIYQSVLDARHKSSRPAAATT